MKRRHILIAIPVLSAVVWIIEGLFDYFIFHPDNTSRVILLGENTHDLFFRGFTVGLFLSFGLTAALIIERLTRAERTTSRLNRFLRAIRDVGQTITRETDPHRLITTACETLTATQGFATAWIVLFNASGNVQDAVGTIDSDSIAGIVDMFRRNEPPDCARQFSGDQNVRVLRRIGEHCGNCPMARADAGNWAMSVRLEHAGMQYGIMTVSVPAVLGIEEEEIELFSEVADDLAHALHTMELERERAGTIAALAESEHRHRSLFENIPNGVMILRKDEHGDFRVVSMNPAAEEIEVVHRQSAIGRKVAGVFPRVAETGLVEILNNVFTTKVTEHHWPIRFEGPHGESWREYVVYCLPSGELVTVYSDITDRIANERALFETKERYQTLFDSAADAIFIHDTGGRILEANAAACERLGYTGLELEGMTLADIEDPTLRDRRLSFMKRICNDGCTMYETVHISRDGVSIPLEASSQMIEFRGGTAILSIARDLTKRKRAEEELVRYQHAVEASGDMIVAVDRDYRYILVNESFLRYHNIRREDFIGKTAEEFIGEPSYERDIRWRLDRCLAGEEVRFDLLRQYDHLGNRWQALAYYPLRGEDGAIHGIVVSMTDITERKRQEEALLLYRNAVEAADEVIVAVDRDYRFILVNRAWLAFTGSRREDVIGVHASDIVGSDYFDTEIRPYLERSLDGEFNDIEVSMATKKAGHRFGIMAFNPLRTNGTVTGVVATIRDITERRKASDALRHSEQRYRALFENMMSGFVNMKVVTDDAGRPVDLKVLAVNAAIEEMLGVPRKQLVGSHATEIFPTVHGSEYDWIGEIGRIGLHGGSLAREKFIHTKNIWVVFNAFSPRQGYVAALFENVTERRKVEEDLARERHLLRALMDNTPVNIYFKDLESRFIMINRAMAAWFGMHDPQDAVGKTDKDIHSADFARQTYADERHVIESGEPIINKEEHEIWPDGHETWVSSTKVPLRDEQGEPTGIIGITLNITERKILENQLHQAQKMEMVARLAGGIAHDFNNILTAIMGYCNILMLELPEGSSYCDDVEEILNTSQRAADLTRQLLAFSRRQIIKPRVVNLNDVLMDLDRMLRRLIGEDIMLDTRIDRDLWPVKVDPGQIEQVLTNLAVNARDAMPQGGRITIETGNAVLDAEYARTHPDVRPGPHVLLAITDTGEGMDEQTLARIFEPFYTTKDKGTGLGLSTCYGIVKQNHGNIWVYSEPGKGTSFKIYLPRTQGDPESAGRGTGSTPLPTGNERILLVEDEQAVRDSAKRILTGLGYSVTDAANGAEALDVATFGEYDLLVTDVVMPRMGGRELAENLLRERPDLRVLYMSGYTDHAIVNHGVLDEGIAFIQKPFVASEFATKIRAVLDGTLQE